jgi:hypothetical protein
MTIVKLDPSRYTADGNELYSAATTLASAWRSASSTLSGLSGMAGDDDGAEEFAPDYDKAAQHAADRTVAIVNVLKAFDAMLDTTGTIYKSAQMVGAGQNPGTASSSSFSPLDAPSLPSSLGAGWPGSLGEFQEFIEDALSAIGVRLPTGDTGKLETGSQAWKQLADALRSSRSSVSGAFDGVLASDIPQKNEILSVRSTVMEWMTDTAGTADELSEALSTLKKNIEDTREELAMFLAQMAVELAVDLGLTAVLSVALPGIGTLLGGGKAAATIAKWVMKIAELIHKLRILNRIPATRLAAMIRTGLKEVSIGTVSSTISSAGVGTAFTAIKGEAITAKGVFSMAAGGFVGGMAGGVTGGSASKLLGRGANTVTNGLKKFTSGALEGGVDGGLGGLAEGAVSGQGGNPLTNIVAGAILGGGVSSATPSGGAGHGSTHGSTNTTMHIGPTNSGSSSASTGGHGGAGHGGAGNGGAHQPDFTVPSTPASGGSTGSSSSGGAGGGGAHVPQGGAPTPAGGVAAGAGAAAGGGVHVPSGDAPTPTGGNASSGGAPAGGGVHVPSGDAPTATPGDFDAPATDAPTVDAPTVDSPAVDAPAVDAPPVDAPAVDAPPTDAPAADLPAAATAGADAPAADAPATDTSVPDTPAADVPAADMPAADAPAADAPAVEAPAAEAPAADASATTAAGTDGSAAATASNANASAQSPIDLPGSDFDVPDTHPVDSPAATAPGSVTGGSATSVTDASDLHIPPPTDIDTSHFTTDLHAETSESTNASDATASGDSPDASDADSSSADGSDGSDANDSGAPSPSSATPHQDAIAAGTDPMHVGADHGSGWHRVADDPVTPIDLHYGEPHSGHGSADPIPGLNSDGSNAATLGLVDDSGAPWGRDSDGNPLSKADYDARYTHASVDANGNPVSEDFYPPNHGAVRGTTVAFDDLGSYVSHYGAQLDRIGYPGGEYLGVRLDGNPASFEQRGLPVSSLGKPYSQYDLSTTSLPKGWKIEVSEIAPAFGRGGGGVQMRVIDRNGEVMSVKALLNKGFLK